MKLSRTSCVPAIRNEIKSYIVCSGYTMQEVVDLLSEDYGWSDSV